MRMFDFSSAIREAGLASALAVPFELELQLMELSNNLEIQLVQEIVDEIQELDPIPDLPLDRWRDTLLEKVGSVSIPFAECD